LQVPDLQRKELRILMLEGDRNDVILQQRELKKGGLSFVSKWVVTREDFIRELTDFEPDIILSDYELPDFDGISALYLVQLITPDIPFIFVTGMTGEELAIDMFKRGAFNYVFKTELSELGPAVRHAMKHATGDIKKQAKLKDSETRYRRLFETSQDGILILNAVTGQIDDVNPYLVDMLGYSHEELLGKRLWEIGAFKNNTLAQQEFVKLQEKEYIRYEDMPLETKSGKAIEAEFVSNVYFVNGKRVIQCDIRDITKRKQAETRVKRTVRAPPSYKRIFLGLFLLAELFLVGIDLYYLYGQNDTVREFLLDWAISTGVIVALLIITYLAVKQIFMRYVEQYSILEGIVESTDSPIFSVDTDYCYTSFNRTHAAVMKALFDADIELGKNMLEYHTVGADRVEAKHNVDRALSGTTVFEEAFSGEEALSRLCFEVSHSPIRGGDGQIIGVAMLARDVTERKKTEEALRRTQFTVDKSGDSVLWFTPNGKVIYANNEACHRRGYAREEMLSLTVFDINVDADHGLWKTMAATIRQHGSFSREFNHCCKDGTLFPVEATLDRFEFGGDEIFVANVRDITERKEAETELLRLEGELYSALNTLPDTMFEVDSGGLIHDYHSPQTDILYVPPEEFIGKTVEEVLPENASKAIMGAMSKVVNTQERGYATYSIEMPDGIHWYELSIAPKGKPDSNRLVALVRDITERKATEETLRVSEERYRTLFEASRDALMTLASPSWRFTSCNSMTLEMFGAKDESEFTSVSPWDLSPQLQPDGRASADKAREMIDKALRDGSYLFEWTHRRLGGEEFPATVLLTSMEFGGETVVQATVRDMTERKLAEEATERYSRELEAANRELESFSYSVSHDLRAPLRAVKGFGRMLLTEHLEELDEEGKRLLGIIISNTEAMEELIEGVLVLSRINREDLNIDSLDMTSLVRDCIGELDVEGRDVEFIVHDLPSARGGRALVRQVFSNLISNAVKFTGRKEKAVIEIGSETQNGQDVYFVKDNGDGFDMKHADKLFGVFKRLHKEDDFPGLGIGLATVQRIINRHGGKVWAEGKKGEGAVIYFFLPRQEA
jgi:PAS domain S-box-containing protein